MISKEIEKLLVTASAYTTPDHLILHQHETPISAEETTSRVARYYERARYSVDYTEEHLLRRTAIERILRRRLTLDFIKEEGGLSFIVELIQSGYLPNNTLSARIILPVEAILHKTIFFIDILEKIHPEETHTHFRSLSIKLATAELDELLFPSIIAEATFKSFYKTIKQHVSIIGSNKSQEENDVQTYLACRRGLLKDSDAQLFYRLWQLHYPEWIELNHPTEENDERIKQIAEEFQKIQLLISEELRRDTQHRLIPKLKNDIIFFSIIQKIVSRHPQTAQDIFNDSKHLSALSRVIAHEEYDLVKKKTRKTAGRAIVYILITKTVLAVSLELPYEIFILKQTHYLGLMINVIFHPLLLLTMTQNIGTPSTQNTDEIEQGIKSIVAGNGHKEIVLDIQDKRSIFISVATFLYVILFFSIFGGIIWTLTEKLHFNIVGTGFFVLFLTFVSYFGLRIRYNSKQWIVHSSTQSSVSFLWDILSLPIVSLGRWLAIKFQSINIFIFIMDFIIEAPFKVVLRAIDTFALYIKQKKDEIY